MFTCFILWWLWKIHTKKERDILNQITFNECLLKRSMFMYSSILFIRISSEIIFNFPYKWNQLNASKRAWLCRIDRRRYEICLFDELFFYQDKKCFILLCFVSYFNSNNALANGTTYSHNNTLVGFAPHIHMLLLHTQM